MLVVGNRFGNVAAYAASYPRVVDVTAREWAWFLVGTARRAGSFVGEIAGGVGVFIAALVVAAGIGALVGWLLLG
jgi:hypothetical protein